MKQFILFSASLILLFSCKVAGKEEFDAMANDFCTCVNKQSNVLSEKLKNTIIDAKKSNANVNEAIANYSRNHPENSLSEAKNLLKFSTVLTKCQKNTQKKYKDLYTMDNNSEVQKKFMKAINELPNCELSKSIITN